MTYSSLLSKVSNHKKLSVALAAGILLTVVPVTPAAAATHSEIVQRLESYGVAPATAEVLASEYDAGQLWNSLDGVSSPVSTTESVSQGYSVTEDVYADGSINITKVALPQSPLSRAYLAGCSSTSGSSFVNYTNCKVVRDSVVFLMAFTADFSYYPGPNNDKIIKAINPYYGSCFGFCGSPSVTINQQVENGSTPASARLQMTFGTVPWFTSVAWLDLRVGAQTVTLVEG